VELRQRACNKHRLRQHCLLVSFTFADSLSCRVKQVLDVVLECCLCCAGTDATLGPASPAQAPAPPSAISRAISRAASKRVESGERMGTLVRSCRLQTQPAHVFPKSGCDDSSLASRESCGHAYGTQRLWLRDGCNVHHMSSQVRHSRVTAVWDDEPVPAVPAPRDHTPALQGQTGQHTTQARLTASHQDVMQSVLVTIVSWQSH